jgi:tRNA threonylcarbamoyladenosine biosynthesis protein TsaB
MKILGIDTTTKNLSLAVYDAGRIYEYNLEVSRKLSCFLAPAIKGVLDALNWKAQDIDFFVCGLGPGSFTGMRTGIATIKAMSWALDKPVIGISTLDIIARNAGESDKQIIPAIDAKRNLIYCSVFKNSKGLLKRIKPYLLIGEKEFLNIVKPGAIILGDALSLYGSKFSGARRGITLLDKDYWYPKPRFIIELALEKIKEKKISDTFNLAPIYLYPKECQIRAKNG